MGHAMSARYRRELASPNLPHLHALIALRPLVRLIRKVLRAVSPTHHEPLEFKEPYITSALEGAALHYQEHRWAFLPNIFPLEIHRALLEQFPKRCYLEPPSSIDKAYDIGLHFERNHKTPRFLKEHPVYGELMKYIDSREFLQRLEKAAGLSTSLLARSSLVNRTYPGSLVTPHKDDPIANKTVPYINMVFFIDGTGGGNSGELTLAHDNEYRDLIFTPPSLTNTCLMYDAYAPMYHGFPPVAWGKKRFAFTANFTSVDYRD